MSGLKTTSVVSVREDLSDIIDNISPKETPLYTMLPKVSARSTRHEWLVDDLGNPDKDNAAAEGAVFATKPGIVAQKRSNVSQIFTEYAEVSRTLQRVDTAGAANEMTRQKALKTSKIKLDIEAALVSANPTVDGSNGAAKLAGMEGWIQTNVSHGSGGSTPGFSNGNVGAVVNGTVRNLTEALFAGVLQTAYDNGGTGITKVFAPSGLKRAMGSFAGNVERHIDGGSKRIANGIKVYDGDFHEVDVIPHRRVTATTIMAFDPNKWALGVVDKLTSEPLAKDRDGDRVALVTEVTLICRNEKANAKLADVRPS